MTISFENPAADKNRLESDGALTPKFDMHGLLTAVVTDIGDGELLMVAHMDRQALALTLETGIAHYFSRSRKRIWKKGESSGNFQRVHECRIDCDQDAIWLKVAVGGHGAACHTGRRSCFYRVASIENGAPIVRTSDDLRRFDHADGSTL